MSILERMRVFLPVVCHLLDIPSKGPQVQPRRWRVPMSTVCSLQNLSICFANCKSQNGLIYRPGDGIYHLHFMEKKTSLERYIYSILLNSVYSIQCCKRTHPFISCKKRSEKGLPRSWVYHAIHFSRVWLFVTLCTIALQAPWSMEFSRQEFWSGLPCPSPGDLPDPGIEYVSLTSPVLVSRFFTTSATWEVPGVYRQKRVKWSSFRQSFDKDLFGTDRIAERG